MAAARIAPWLVAATVAIACAAPTLPDAGRDAGAPPGTDLGRADGVVDGGPEALPDGWAQLGDLVGSIYDLVQLPDGTVVAAQSLVPERWISTSRVNTRILELTREGAWQEIESPFELNGLESSVDFMDVRAGRLLVTGVTDDQVLLVYERDGDEWRLLLEEPTVLGGVIRVRTGAGDTMLIQVGLRGRLLSGLPDPYFDQDLFVWSGDEVERIGGPETPCSEFLPPDVVAVLDGEGRPVVSHQGRGCEPETAWIRRWDGGEWTTLWSSETDTLALDLGYDAARDTLLSTRTLDLDFAPADLCDFGPEPTACTSLGLGRSECASDSPFRSSTPLRALAGGGAVAGVVEICREPATAESPPREAFLWVDGETVPTPGNEALQVVLPVDGGVLAASRSGVYRFALP